MHIKIIFMDNMTQVMTEDDLAFNCSKKEHGALGKRD